MSHTIVDIDTELHTRYYDSSSHSEVKTESAFSRVSAVGDIFFFIFKVHSGMEKKWPSTFTFIGDFDRSLQPSIGHSTFNPALPRLVKAFQSGYKICALNLWNVCGAFYLRKFFEFMDSREFSWILLFSDARSWFCILSRTQIASPQKNLQIYSQETSWMASSYCGCGRICAPHRTRYYGIIFGFSGPDDHCSPNPGHVVVVYLARISGAKWPFGISFSFDVFPRIPWLSSSQVSQKKIE